MAREEIGFVPEPSLPSPTLGREEQAHLEIGHTDVTPRTASVLVILFLLMIAVVPLVEWFGVRATRAQGLEPSWSHLTELPQELRVHRESVPAGRGVWEAVVSTNRVVLAALSSFEQGLEHESVLGRALRPYAQVILTRLLGVGNERVYKGADGWLFYRPDIEYVTGQPFLDQRTLERRIEAVSEWDRPPQPDPRPAIARFRRDLEARGIALVVMPTPVKPSVHPEALAGRYRAVRGALQNPSYRAFVDDLRQDGTLVFDAGEPLAAARGSGPQYLETDTHWRPEAMEAVADRLARFIRSNAELPDAVDPSYRVARQAIRNTGDVARMLDLAEGSTLYPPETVWLRRVLRPDGSSWRSSRDADVLLLGDSFANMYSLESMGWGTSAGLAEQLSYALARPVDRLVQNDEGAHATRAMLQRDPSRLEGKRIVLYQFAARELAFGDWRVLPLP